MKTALRITLLSTLIGCSTTPYDWDGYDFEHPDKQPPAPTPLATDLCDDDTYPTATWQEMSSAHFTLSYLPGTAAEADRQVIATRLESAYANIRGQLGIIAEPTLTVNLSPNRMAALEHDRGYGSGWPWLDRYDVVYTGAADSYEVSRYGQLLALMLDYHFDTTNRNRLALLTTGLAQYLDQSGRDLHTAYAKQLIAGVESRVRIAELDSRDVSARNVGRAGSLVQFLIERYGMETFVEMYRATAVNWTGNCYAHESYGCMNTPEAITMLLDGVLMSAVGEAWLQVQPLWQAEVEAALAAMPLGTSTTATAEIKNVLRVMDEAMRTGDPAMYRSTLEGFYCEYGGETLREQVSDRAVNAWSATTTRLIAVYDTGIKNFSTAQALVQRTDESGMPMFSTLYLEHLPVGWRVTWGPDWF